jgi:hypothetical protein
VDELSQLVERPVALLASLRATNRSLADTAQIFQSDRPASVLRFLNKQLADGVIGVFLKTGLLSGELLEFAFGGPGLFLLQVLSAMFKNAAITLDICAAEILPSAVNSEVQNAQVYAQNSFHVHCFGRLHLTCHQQIKLAFDIAQVTLPPLTAQQLQLPFSRREGDPLTAVYCPNGDFLPFEMIGKNAAVKPDRSLGLEPALPFLVKLISVGNFGITAHNDLRAQPKPIQHLSIGQFVQIELAKGSMLPGLLADVLQALFATSSVLRSAFACSGEGSSFTWAVSFIEQAYYLFTTLPRKEQG